MPLQNLGSNQFFWQTTGAGIETLSLDAHGTRLVTSSADYLSVSNGAVNVTRPGGALALRPGVNLPVTATGKVSGATLGKLVAKALPLVGLLTTGVALYELAKELGFLVTKNPDGTVSVGKSDPSLCTSAPCYEYHATIPTSTANYWGTYYPSSNQAIQIAIDYDNGRSAYWEYKLLSINGTQNGTYTFSIKNKTTGNSAGTGTGYFESRSTPPVGPAYLPSSQQELTDAIANKTNWPDSSNIPQAIADAQRLTGDTIATQNPTISGPASVTGPAEVTKTPIPNGTKETTKQTQFDCHYNDPSYDGTIPGTVVCTDTTTTTDKNTVTDPQTQQTTTTTTQTSQTTKPADATAQKPLETKDPCEANPDRVGCATLDTPTGEIPKTTKSIDFAPVNLGFGGGACPANVVQNIKGQPVTIVNWTSSCGYIVQYAKPLILTLATFSALLIIFLGGKTE